MLYATARVSGSASASCACWLASLQPALLDQHRRSLEFAAVFPGCRRTTVGTALRLTVDRSRDAVDDASGRSSTPHTSSVWRALRVRARCSGSCGPSRRALGSPDGLEPDPHRASENGSAPPGDLGVSNMEGRTVSSRLSVDLASRNRIGTQTERSRRVALGVDEPKRRRAPVRVRVAGQRPVEEVAELRLEPDLLVAQAEHLEDVDVLAVGPEPAHVAVALRRVPELERPRIGPGARLRCLLVERIEVAAVPQPRRRPTCDSAASAC